jgi:hypothetical protein
MYCSSYSHLPLLLYFEQQLFVFSSMKCLLEVLTRQYTRTLFRSKIHVHTYLIIHSVPTFNKFLCNAGNSQSLSLLASTPENNFPTVCNNNNNNNNNFNNNSPSIIYRLPLISLLSTNCFY